MKKIVSALLSGAIGLTAVPFTAVAELSDKIVDSPSWDEISDAVYEQCDFNNDGIVDSKDVYILLYRYCELAAGEEDRPGYGEAERANADKYGDIDGNGVIDGRDATYLATYNKQRKGIELVNIDVILNDIDINAVDGGNFSMAEQMSYALSFVLTDEAVFAQCDYNSDGTVNALDAQCLSTYYAQNAVGRFEAKDDIGYDEEARDKIEQIGALTDIAGGQITAIDVTYLLQYIVNNSEVGDIDSNGTIDGRDASIVCAYYFAASTNGDYTSVPFYSVLNKLGDFDGNGVVDLCDASAILTAYAESSIQ